MNKNLSKAIKIVKDGGIIIYPTDTAFGIGCRIDKIDAVKKLYKIRRRPNEKAVPVLVSSITMAKKYADQNKLAQKLAKKYWPGGLTIVSKNVSVSKVVTGGGETVGLRMPNHASILKLIRGVGVPIVGCSANFAGNFTPYKTSDLDFELINLVDFVLPGRCSKKRSSTVVDATGKNIKILRQGAIKL